MKIIETLTLRGSNFFADQSVAATFLDMGPLVGRTNAHLVEPRLNALARLLPALPAGALAPDVALQATFGHLAAALQSSLGRTVFASRVLPLTTRERFVVLHGYDVAMIAEEAARLAQRLIVWTVPDSTAIKLEVQHRLDPTRAVQRFLSSAPTFFLDQTTQALVDEAERRGIFWHRPSDLDRLVQFGHGCRLQRTRETVTGNTVALASNIARSKAQTRRLYAELSLPTTRQILVTKEDEAVRAAERLGYPVVVKPENRGKALAVSVGLKDRDAVIAAFRKAIGASPLVLVEAVVPGNDYRMLVIKGHCVASVKRVAAHVIGDGKRSVDELVEELNRDPRRGAGFSNLLVTIEFDDDVARMLESAGLTRSSIPAEGQRVQLRSASSLSAGGISVDVTSQVHPDNRLAAERAARVAGLDIAGVDFMSPDIGRSWREVGGAILEINSSPSLRGHWIGEGSQRVTRLVFDSLIPPGAETRIPIAAITGTVGKTTTTLLVAHILGLNGRVVGAATTEGVLIDRELIAQGDFAGTSGAKLLLMDPLVEAAVLESSRRGLLRRGLFFDRCDVGAVLNVGTDHVGMDDISTAADLARLKRLVVARASRLAVLNADNPYCVGMVPGLDAARLCFVSCDSSNPLIEAHLARGQPAVWLDDAAEAGIQFHDGAELQRLIAVNEIPIALNGAARHNVQNAMFAAAISYGLGETLDTIREGLRTFVSGHDQNPGRFNVYDGLPFRVILENAANADAITAMAAFSRKLEISGRRILVLWSQGNRIDAHYAAVARAAAPGFDYFVCTEPLDPRGRAHGEISQRLAAGIRSAGVGEDRIQVLVRQDDAVGHALGLARPGDFVMICCHDTQRAWRQIVAFKPQTRA